MRAKFGLVPTAVSKILSFKFISRLGGVGCQLSCNSVKMHYKGTIFNVISVTSGWVGSNSQEKSELFTLIAPDTLDIYDKLEPIFQLSMLKNTSWLRNAVEPLLYDHPRITLVWSYKRDGRS